jgi:hypothetical protein
MDDELEELCRSAWKAHHAAAGEHQLLLPNEQWLVTPSAPILFFGDLQHFKKSKLHVITVALNPSRLEFPPNTRFRRFPTIDGRNMVIYVNWQVWPS